MAVFQATLWKSGFSGKRLMIGSMSAITTAFPMAKALIVTATNVIGAIPVPLSIRTRMYATMCRATKKKSVGGRISRNSFQILVRSLFIVPPLDQRARGARSATATAAEPAAATEVALGGAAIEAVEALLAFASRLLLSCHGGGLFGFGALPAAARVLLPAAAGVLVHVAVHVGVVVVADARSLVARALAGARVGDRAARFGRMLPIHIGCTLALPGCADPRLGRVDGACRPPSDRSGLRVVLRPARHRPRRPGVRIHGAALVARAPLTGDRVVATRGLNVRDRAGTCIHRRIAASYPDVSGRRVVAVRARARGNRVTPVAVDVLGGRGPPATSACSVEPAVVRTPVG